MKNLNDYIINEGLKDSFVNIFKNLFYHGEVSTKNLVTINCDPKIFGNLQRDKDYFNPQKNDNYPKLVPSFMALDDMFELYHLEKGKDKYGNVQDLYTYIGYADFRKGNNKLEIDKNYQEFVEKVLEKYNK